MSWIDDNSSEIAQTEWQEHDRKIKMTDKRRQEIVERTKLLTGQDYIDGFEAGCEWADQTNPHKEALNVVLEALNGVRNWGFSPTAVAIAARVDKALAEIDKILREGK